MKDLPAGAGAPGGSPRIDDLDVAAVQRRTVTVLAASQALGGLGLTVGIAVASVLAEDISGSQALAGLVQTMQVVGAAFASYLLARLMESRGRRVGLAAGFTLGAGGAGVCVVGGVLESFPVLLLGGFLLGANSAAGYQSRYAAADLAEPTHRARALSVVLWATTVGAVLGPNLVGVAGDVARQLGIPALTGPFLLTAVVGIAAAALLTLLLRPDPLLLARRLADDGGAAARPRTPWRRVARLVRSSPAIGGAVLAMAGSHAVMVAVMVMTPLHMHHGGAELDIIGLVISVHVLGMFFFSPFLGMLSDRVGRPVVLLVGAATLWTALWLSGSSPAGASFGIGAGLFLLGLGWSCCTVAASALLTEATPFGDRTAVQGAADLLMNVAAALAGVLAGTIVDAGGFGWLNGFAAVLVLVVLLGALAARRSSRSWEPQSAR